MKNTKKTKQLIAFTLAEVLITLGIIGIVAEMTIPTLMNNVQDKAEKVGWKKAFSELSQANQQIITDNGGIDFAGQCANFDDVCLKNLFAAKIKTIKNCTNPVTEGCVVDNSKYLNGTTAGFTPINSDTWPAIVTNSGYSIKFRYHNLNCDFSAPRGCGWMQVDVNGTKKPNIVGRDIYFINITPNKLTPVGETGDYDPSIDCAPGGAGVGCSSKYLLN